MTRQIAFGYGAPSVPELEERIHTLETQVASLTEAVRILTAGLAGTPFDEPGSQEASASARRAHELLITVPPSRRTG
ncbi:hypothetical protein [Spirillospora sp. NPDC047279]|uniref:hypothetical protein n=1 Tax=Spirillospora sp. NPDC047279 TaxID=3155478 RepID=UPI0034098FB8